MKPDGELLREKLNVLSKLRFHNIKITERMKKAFLNVPREEFVLPKYKNRAYIDTPLPIHAGQTISAIHMVMIYVSPSCTDPQIGETVLEIGAGSGYNAAIFAEMVAPEGVENPGHIYAIEIIPELAEFAKDNIERSGYTDCVTILESDGGNGYPEKSPFNIISVAAASKLIPPPLQEQIAFNGRLVIPINKMLYQELVLITKDETGNISKKNLGGVAFVPLTGKYG